MLSRIGRFLKKVRSRKGYTLVEAATVVAITGAMAIVSVPIASDKIEDGKISTAGGSTQAIATAMVKFFGDTGFFPLANTLAPVASGAIGGVITDGDGVNTSDRNKVMRSGLTSVGVAEDTNNLDPDLDTVLNTSGNLVLWQSGTVTRSGAAAADSNLNDHIVADNPSGGSYASGGLNWFGPYVPAVDQDPWGRNYLIYMAALDPANLSPLAASGNQSNILVPGETGDGKTAIDTSANERVYAWVISSGPDEKLQTDPTNSILKGDDIGTLLSIPPVLKGSNDAKQK